MHTRNHSSPDESVPQGMKRNHERLRTPSNLMMCITVTEQTENSGNEFFHRDQ